MSKKMPENTILGLVMARGFGPTPANMGTPEWVVEAIAEAKHAHEAGNPFAAADVICLCDEHKFEPPSWALSGVFIRWIKDVKQVRLGARRGRHSRMLQHIMDNHNHFQRYVAFNEALREGEMRVDAAVRAAHLLEMTSGAGTAQTVEKSYRRVRSAINKGRRADYWYPASVTLSGLIKQAYRLPSWGTFVPLRS